MLLNNRSFIFFILFSQLFTYALAEETLYLEIIINGRNTNHVAQIIRKENDWEISAVDFSALGLQLEFGGREKFLLGSLGITDIRYDSEFQRLFITVPGSLLPLQYFNANNPSYAGTKPRRDMGAFVNYNLVSIAGNADVRLTSAWHELHFFKNDFYVVSNGIAQSNNDRYSTSGYTRFETYYKADNEDSMQSLTIGDVINATPNWGRSIRLAGIRISRDYDLNPSLITYPLPEFYGESALPGSVDLIINNQLRWRDQVTSGPFLINMMPYMSGAGIAQVVTTNPQGQQLQQSLSFYVTNELLAPGMLDYDLTIGFRRKNFGFESNSYANLPITSTSIRYGFNKYLTPQLLMQAGDGIHLAGAGLTFLVGSLGVVDIAAAASDYYLYQSDLNEHGKQASISYDYTYKKIGINASHLRRYGNYRDLGTQNEISLSNTLNLIQSQISFSFHDNRLGGFNVGYFRTVNRENVARSILNFSWSQYFYSGLSTFLSINRSLFEKRENTINFTLSFPLGARGQTSGSTQRNTNGELHNQVQAMSNAPYSGGFGWGLSADDSDEKNRYIEGDWRTKYIDASISAYRSGNQTQYMGTLDGALIYMEGDIYATRFVNDAFAIVDAGEKNVPVMFGHQLIGRTDSNGKLLVPDLNSYLENRLAIDPMLLPANAIIDSIEQLVVPRRKGGIHVEFPVRFSQSALVKVITIKNQPLPAGAILMERDSEKNHTTGWDGEVYLENLDAPLVLYWAEGECFITLQPAADSSLALPRLGPFVCEPATERQQ
ncbi:MAG: fimbria/pilus outer membrane usher protein [Cellvibrio sp.]